MKKFNSSDNKFLSILFVFVFIGLAQIAAAQTHVIILKGNKNPNEIANMICINTGSIFTAVLENGDKKALTNVMVTITMTDGKNNIITSIHNIGTINSASMGSANISIPASFPSNTGSIFLDISYNLGGMPVSISQEVPFVVGCDD